MANIDLTAYRKDELAERDWMDPCAEFYLASEVDNLIADKDREIARLKDRKSPDIADALALSPAGKPFVDPGFAKKEPVEDTREAVAELKDKYCTHCVICGKPWGAGALHVLHRITFHGRFVTNLYTCCDCNAKISCGVI
jgi:hypothetical protein